MGREWDSNCAFVYSWANVGMKRFKTILALGVLALLWAVQGCKNDTTPVNRAFYYWKSDEWDFSYKEYEILDSLDVQKIYVKFFEVDYSPELGSHPISKTRLSMRYYGEQRNFSIVPTVYLRNSVFKNITIEELDLLADNTHFLIQKYLGDELESLTADEYQMDCDWTQSTKENYFYFLKKLKSISGKKISVTLRLYPCKYPDIMGVPPADRAMLMCYNLLNPIDNPQKNGILDVAELELYLEDTKPYPMPLDIALPIYSWAQVYHNEIFSDILYCDIDDLKPIMKQEKPMWYTVMSDTLIGGVYLREGDQLKCEEMNPEIIKDAISLLRKYLDINENTTVSLFHLDQLKIGKFKNEELSSFYTDFSK